MRNVQRAARFVGAVVITAVMATSAVQAQQALGDFANDLIVSSSTYTDPMFTAGTALPNSATGTGPSTVSATNDSAFCTNGSCSSNVWNNDTPDPNFGITSDIILQNVNTKTGVVDNTVNVTQIAAAAGVNLVTSFSSKSELAINTSPSGTSLTFMGYNTTAGQLDISNSNTPGSLEPGNTDIANPTLRAVGEIKPGHQLGAGHYDQCHHNGNNGRAAIASRKRSILHGGQCR